MNERRRGQGEKEKEMVYGMEDKEDICGKKKNRAAEEQMKKGRTFLRTIQVKLVKSVSTLLVP